MGITFSGEGIKREACSGRHVLLDGYWRMMLMMMQMRRMRIKMMAIAAVMIMGTVMMMTETKTMTTTPEQMLIGTIWKKDSLQIRVMQELFPQTGIPITTAHSMKMTRRRLTSRLICQVIFGWMHRVQQYSVA